MCGGMIMWLLKRTLVKKIFCWSKTVYISNIILHFNLILRNIPILSIMFSMAIFHDYLKNNLATISDAFKYPNQKGNTGCCKKFQTCLPFSMGADRRKEFNSKQ